MDVKIEEVSPCRNRVQITVPSERVRETFDRHYKDLKSAVNLKGFRPGKVPMSFLEKKFGSEVAQQVKINLVEESLEEALKEHKLDPISEPELELDKILVERSADMAFEAFVEVRPTFDLPEYKGVKVDAPAVEVTDEEVDAEIERIRRQHATLEPCEPDAIGDDHVLEATVSVMVGGETAVKDEPQMIGPKTSSAAGIVVDGLREKAVEAGIGGTARVDVEVPSYFPDAQFRGKAATMIIKIAEAKQIVLPALDDEFAEQLDFDDIAELRTRVTDAIRAHKDSDAHRAIEEQVLDSLIEKAPFSVPPGLLKRQVDRLVARARVDLESQGKSGEEIDEAIGEIAKAQEEDVTRSIKVSLLLDEIAKKEKIFVTEDELSRHLEALGARHGQTGDQVREQYEAQNLIGEVRFHLREAKTRAVLRENAKS